jgi:hypothetical protein
MKSDKTQVSVRALECLIWVAWSPFGGIRVRLTSLFELGLGKVRRLEGSVPSPRIELDLYYQLAFEAL